MFAMPRSLILAIAICSFAGISASADEVFVLRGGKSELPIILDERGCTAAEVRTLRSAGDWLGECLKRASGATLEVGSKVDRKPAIVLARSQQWEELARAAGVSTDRYDDYAIITRSDQRRVYVLGHSAAAIQFGVADLLRRWGFRWFAPSPRWHVVPKFKNLSVDLTVAESPQLIDRRIWYAYGMNGDTKPLLKDYERWAIANRLTLRGLTRTGHSYGHIIGRNKQAFESRPELSALLTDGTRDQTSVPNARKFCFSNPDLIELVANDRWRLLETNRRANPHTFMVSVDPSDGQGTCHCEQCRALGTTTDRVFHLANETAKRLREKDPSAWVGLYAYSSHRLPPTINVEPNVYVQVAMAFNRTQYSLPELVDRWSKKVKAVGLREYYGVEAWDWGLPGRARGGQVAYHRKWIPFYADRNLNGVNAETNANWGAQALGLYVAAQLLWNPRANVNAHVDDFVEALFPGVESHMRSFYTKLEAAPQLRPSTLLPLFQNLKNAASQTRDARVLARINDLKAYLVYVVKFREFDLTKNRKQTHGDEYYHSLKALMNYSWRIRHRDVVHTYALARRLCNAAPLKDNRPEFSLATKGRVPVWQDGEALTDSEVDDRFDQAIRGLQADGDPTVNFSRYFEKVSLPGNDAGPTQLHAGQPEANSRAAKSRFRSGLRGYLTVAGKETVKFSITPTAKPVTVTVFMRDKILFEKEIRRDSESPDAAYDVRVELPRAFEYRVQVSGNFEITVPPETPLIFEASVNHPAWISYSGPHYFYVPKGTRELVFDAGPRLSIDIPSVGRRDFAPADRADGKSYISVPVPEGTDGQVWHTASQTRGQVMLMNVPPLFSFHRSTTFVPRELSESEGLTTAP